MENFVYIVLCHLFGDYFLQSDYLAANKGKDWYILFVHSALYCIPFIVVFGLDIGAFYIFVTHFVVDAAKARWNDINLFQDQVIHYVVACLTYL
jgi:hypothetical protein